MVQSHLSTLNHKLFELIYQLFLTLYQKNYLILQQILFLGFAHYHFDSTEPRKHFEPYFHIQVDNI